MRVRFGTATDVGRVRAHNEDSLYAKPPLFSVADGMGGHEAGEVASSLALEALVDAMPPGDDVSAWLAEAVRAANRRVFDHGTERGGTLRMGTTLTAAFAGEDALYLAHVGDSRAYLLHDGRLRQVTDDHSLVAEWVREGRLSAAEAAVHPQRSVITRALGIEPDVEIDVVRVAPTDGDRVLLCSDGLTGPVSDAAVSEVLQDVEDPDEAAQRLVELANEGGGEDNITAIVIDVVEGPARDKVPSDLTDDTVATTTIAAVGAGAGAAASVGSDGADTLPSAKASKTDTALLAPVGENDTDTEPGTEAGTEEPGDEAEAKPGEKADAPVGIKVHDRKPDPPAPVRSTGKPEEGGRRFWIRIVIAVVTIAVLGIGGWIALGWFVDNSWYVGELDGNVTIFNGLPEGVLGVDMSNVAERTSLSVAELPEAEQKRVQEGIEADDRADAERIVQNLENRVPTSTTTTTLPTPTTQPPVVPLPPTTLAPVPPVPAPAPVP